MNGTPPPLFGLPRIIADLRKQLGAWDLRGFISTALAVLLFGRLARILTKMEALAAAFQAGTLRRQGSRVGSVPLVAEAERREVPPGREGGETGSVQRVWPSRFGWLVRAVGWEAAGFGGQLRAILEQPETRAFLEACPQAVRTLLPLCRMLSIETSALRPWIKMPEKAPAQPAVKPARVRKPRPKPDLGRVPIPRGVMSAVRRGRYGKIG